VLGQLLRTLMVFLRALRAPRIGLLEESAVGFRVLPGDLDVNVHLNNGRYLALMDLGRFDLLIRAGCSGPWCACAGGPCWVRQWCVIADRCGHSSASSCAAA
jgi:hypothetical protein